MLHLSWTAVFTLAQTHRANEEAAQESGSTRANFSPGVKTILVKISKLCLLSGLATIQLLSQVKHFTLTVINPDILRLQTRHTAVSKKSLDVNDQKNKVTSPVRTVVVIKCRAEKLL